MNRNYNALELLKELLKTLFQFDSTDLDFGIYRIMNYKRKEIEAFIEKDLIQAVEKEFERYRTQSSKELLEKIEEKKKEIERLEKELGEKILKNGEIEEKFKDKPFAKEYAELKRQLSETEITDSTQTQVFNDLYNFFSRYYEDGDFISKRRYSSKDHRYAIPYDGEEVKLYWANFDQYYVKTGEVFKDYEFTIKEWRIIFKTTFAEVEAGNVKGERRYFVLASDQPVKVDNTSKTCLIQFEYKPLTDAVLKQYRIKTKSGEEKKTGISQDDINVLLRDRILQNIKELEIKAILTEEQNEKTILEKHIYKYTRKITSDFFIHKNLKDFLERELDYFIKSEVIDLNNLEPRHITRAKVIEGIGKRIIEFLSQIEDFQKMLWEKKKFVLKTDYVITIDRLPEKLHKEILTNKKQLKEWEELGFGKITKYEDLISRNDLTGRELKKLPVDTKHFSEDFKERLLERLSEQSSLDDLIDGILIKSENWQALNLLQNKCKEKIECIYIDPPYNTGASEILYKNNYKHSSWLSLLENRLEMAKTFLSNKGILCITIDHVELHNLRLLLQIIFGDENILGIISIKSNPSGRSTVKGFSIANEYAIFIGSSAIGLLPRTDEQIAQYDQEDTLGRFQWRNFLRAGGANDFRRARPRLYYPLIVRGNNIRIPKMEWKQELRSWVLKENPIENEQIIYPISGGIEYTWRLGVESLNERLSDIRLRHSKNREPIIEIKFRLDDEGVLPKTVWDSKRYNATAYGTSLLNEIIGVPQAFPFPKSVYAVEDCIRVCDSNGNGYVLDFFAGSGTTAHAVINLNRVDGSRRKYVLVEMGDWFDKVLLPRIKKVIFCEKWRDGKPIGGQGFSHFVQYHCPEQYEDTLHNIEFPQEDKGQKALELFGKADEGNEYLMKYFLRYETEGSPSLLNLKQFENPFEYKLKIISGNKGEEIVNVDLVETFNYLIGLKVNKYKFTKENGRKYVFVFGEKGNRRITAVWRPTKDINLEKDREVIESVIGDYNPDEVFINGDAFYPKGYKVIETEFKALMGV